ncbi:small ubiquitin-related modifier [Galdieria sulphuraria]|uniref:Small ubiquitin-related modifier n=1 Tax=Galdieria sulphuraria TaxID=130081 RepID=M2W7A1_GALSU|nr:small ubiquitin-related modifier [Galdieria sulphuraria]EME31696.1 small ubiquitin-related modifier [Galdieria sulphuraria]|eukprot:XP_005708216.1 small ubiquitin-related modifier [Galdieria sulphuraria]
MMEGLKAEPSTAMSGSLEPSDESKLQITVRDGEGGQMTFRVRKSTKLKKLMSNYCEKQGVAYGTYRFTLDGKRINENDTAETLQMEDGDCIDAFLYQQGGARCESE